jgi:regulatory protein
VTGGPPPDDEWGAAPTHPETEGAESATDDGADGARPRRQADRPPPTAEERLQIALKHAYRHLTKRDRTEAEVRAHLQKRETDPASLEAAIAELLELRYLDDARYVQRYVEDRRRLDGWGPVRITQGLRKMGVDPTLIEPALATVAEQSPDDDLTLATELVARRFHHRPLDGDRDRQKALRAVVGKGHDLDVAYAAVRAYEQRCAEDGNGMDHGAGML